MRSVPVFKSIKVVDHVATGRALRTMRRKEFLKLHEVASKMGISLMYLSNLERGARNWNEDLITRFEKAIKP